MNEDWTLQGPGLPWGKREVGGTRKQHQLCNQAHPPVLSIQAQQGRVWRIRLFLESKVEEVDLHLFHGQPREKGLARFCTPCTVGQISGAAGSQAGLSHTDGADLGHHGGARQSGGDRWEGVRETRASILHDLCRPPFYLPMSQAALRDMSPSCIILYFIQWGRCQ